MGTLSFRQLEKSNANLFYREPRESRVETLSTNKIQKETAARSECQCIGLQFVSNRPMSGQLVARPCKTERTTFHCCHFISVSPFVAVLHLRLPSLRGCYFSLQRRQRTDPVHPRRVKRRLQMRLYESKISFFFNHSTKRISYFGQIVTQTGWS